MKQVKKMKYVKSMLLFMAISCIFLSCKKESDDGGSDCEDNNTTKVTFTNTGTRALRVVVATTLTPQGTAVNPVVNLDLAPGATVSKEFKADLYFVEWFSNCSASCALNTSYKKTYAPCGEYEEKRN